MVRLKLSKKTREILRTLTSTGHGEHDLGRMPSTDTSDFTETLVRLSWEFLGSPTVSNTLESMTLSDGNNIDTLILLEHGANLDRLLEQTLRELNLVGDGSTVDLNLHQVSLLLGKAGLPDLGVSQNTNDSAVFANAFEFTGDRFSAVLSMLLGIPGEGLLLGTVPVLVEATFDFVGEMRSPNGGESTETAGSFDVANDTDDNEWWCLDDGDCLDNLALVHLYFKKVGFRKDQFAKRVTTHWNQDGQDNEQHGSYQPCIP